MLYACRVNNITHIVVIESNCSVQIFLERELHSSEDIECFFYKTLAEALSNSATANAQVVIVQWMFAPMQMSVVIKQCRLHYTNAYIIASFDFYQPDWVYRALCAGAAGLLLRPYTLQDVMLNYKSNSITLTQQPLLYHLQKLHY